MTDWRDSAACKDTPYPELWFPISATDALGRQQTASAKAVCASCPVAAPCLEYALDTRQDTGIWGGTTEQQRESMRRKAGRGLGRHPMKDAV